MTDARRYENLKPGVQALILPWSRSRFAGQQCAILASPEYLDVEDQYGRSVRDLVCIVATSTPPEPGGRWAAEARALLPIDGETGLQLTSESREICEPA
jgi:hypothetical protein